MRYNSGMKNMPRGRDHYNWKGGVFDDSRGYIKIYKPEHPFNNDGYVLEHRLVMEKYLGRYLKKEEIVHHKNEVRNDNRIENLEVMTVSKHNGLHSKGNKYRVGKWLSQKAKNKISEKLSNFWKKHSTIVETKCTNCSKKIYRQQYRLKRSKHHFCSFNCYKKHGTGVTVWL